MAMLATFGLILIVWLASAAVTSAIASVSWHLLGSKVAAWHAIERGRLAFATSISPVVLPTLLVFVVITPGLLGLVASGIDHCPLHPEHPHLCLVHPTAALPPILGGILLATSVAGIVGVVRFLWRSRLRARSLRQLAADASTCLAPEVDLVDADRPFALTFGFLRTRTLISTGLVRALRLDQVDTVIAHEREHARRRDPLRQLVARVGSIAIWPPIRRRLLTDLALGAEQACDEKAARIATNRLSVAETILAVEKLLDSQIDKIRPGITGIGGSSVELRVRSLLAEPLRDRRWGPSIAFGILVGVAIATGPLHHALEHFLALILGAR